MKYSRIQLLAFAALVVILLSGCPKTNKKVLYLYNWTYYTPQVILDEFKEATGITVIVDNFASNEEMFAKVM
ncbi:MAG: spermidine/putrescine ABC transporter substrate-binding protein, partial [Sphaerochaetaceae bacterium]